MKILYFSEMRNVRGGGWAGGYSAITEGLCTALARKDHEVKVVGLAYSGAEHNLPFSVIPFLDPQFFAVQLNDIINGWWPDAVVVGLDIPHQGDIFSAISRSRAKYVGIMPVEGEPLLPEWADQLSALDHIITLSKFGVRVFDEAGLTASFMPVAAPLSCSRATDEELKKIHTGAGMDGRFVLLKVADNTTRKNIAHTIEFFAKWSVGKKVTFYLITRPDNPGGWKLPSLIVRFGGKQVADKPLWKFGESELRLMSDVRRNDLIWLYNLARTDSDGAGALLMDTGAEGVGMPTLEAFQVGVPVVGMANTATQELLDENRGILFQNGAKYIDTFGNCDRFLPEYSSWAWALDLAYKDAELRRTVTQNAMAWIEKRSWTEAADVLLGAINGKR